MIIFFYFICRFASKIILFQKAMQFKNTIMFCYSRHSLVRITIRVPPLLTWHICQIVVDYLSLVVTTCVINQSRGHWLLSDAFHFAISTSLKLKKK
jgi:hypothetical protein